MGRPSCGSSCSSPCSEDSETPRRRTGGGSGVSFCSRAIDRRSRSPRLETAKGTDLLRVMISKSLTLVLEIAHPAGGHHVEMEAAVVAREDDCIELYRCGRNMRRRKESEPAHRRGQRGLDKRFSKSRVSRGDRGTSLRGYEDVGGPLRAFLVNMLKHSKPGEGTGWLRCAYDCRCR